MAPGPCPGGGSRHRGYLAPGTGPDGWGSRRCGYMAPGHGPELGNVPESLSHTTRVPSRAEILAPPLGRVTIQSIEIMTCLIETNDLTKILTHFCFPITIPSVTIRRQSSQFPTFEKHPVNFSKYQRKVYKTRIEHLVLRERERERARERETGFDFSKH